MSGVRKYPCPCCGYYTLSEEPPGTYNICPVCFWEDEPLQFTVPTYKGGANGVSLEKAQQNVRVYGWAEERSKEHVRPPLPDEYPPPRTAPGHDRAWRFHRRFSLVRLARVETDSSKLLEQERWCGPLVARCGSGASPILA